MYIDFDSNSVAGGFRNLTGGNYATIESLENDIEIAEKNIGKWKAERQKCLLSLPAKRQRRYGSVRCAKAKFDVMGNGQSKNIQSTINWLNNHIKEKKAELAKVKKKSANSGNGGDTGNGGDSGGGYGGTVVGTGSGANPAIKYVGIGVGVLLIGFLVYKLATRKK